MDVDGLAHLMGLTALVETGGAEATGSVTSVEDATLSVTCDEESWAGTVVGPMQVSVFAPDALYRLSGPTVIKGLDVVIGPDLSIERIQRRKWPRRRLDMPVTVCAVADGRRVEGIPGRTVDVGLGGLCVETLRPVLGEGDPMVILSLPDGTTVVSLTATVGVEDLGDGWRYRLAFRNLDAHDSGRLAELVS
jgi:hypothetical protein